MKNNSELNGIAKYLGIFKDAFSFLANASILSVIKVISIAVTAIIISGVAITGYEVITSDEFVTSLAHKVNNKNNI